MARNRQTQNIPSTDSGRESKKKLVSPPEWKESALAIQVLDCTLRDGGYYTNWDFPTDLVEDYLETMRSLDMDFVEVGYRSPAKDGYFGRYFFLSREDIQRIKNKLGPNTRLAIMLNKKDVKKDQIEGLLKDASDLIDVVRFACPPDGIKECIELAEEVRRLGPEVAINVMYMHTYIDDISKLLPLADAGHCVQYVALVDSYGSCFPEDVEKATRALVENLPQKIGFHGHDNIGLAFANAIAAIRGGAELVDCTVTGMGRGAGNLTTELFMTYLSRQTGKNVAYKRLANLLEKFTALKKQYDWGTSLPYMISGINGLPQADVMHWLGMKRYTASSIVSSLLRHNSAHIDTEELPKLKDSASELGIKSDIAVLIGGGPSALEHVDGLKRFISAKKPTVIHSSLKHATLLGDVDKQLFCLAGEEASSVSEQTLEEIADLSNCWVVQSAPRFGGSVPPVGKACEVDIEINNGHELGPVSDISPLKLALSAALDTGARSIYLFGFDGYTDANHLQSELMAEVQEVIDTTRRRFADVKISSLLPTKYNVDQVSLYAVTMPANI